MLKKEKVQVQTREGTEKDYFIHMRTKYSSLLPAVLDGIYNSVWIVDFDFELHITLLQSSNDADW